MRLLLHVSVVAILGLAANGARADSVPELLHYKFAQVGTSVTNLALTPPVGTGTATIMGAITQTGADLNFANDGFSLMGSGNASTTDYLNTGWATNLSGTSFTISFVSSNITASATLFYIFGDLSAGSFRCFTNGIAGPNNWILRGTNITDTAVNGGATVATHRTTFVYDQNAGNIKGYLDGVLVNTVAQGAAPTISGAGPFKVMGYNTNVGAPIGGLLDDFRVYTRALSAAEVAELDVYSLASVTGNGVVIVDGDSTPDPADDTDFGAAATDLGETVTHTFSIKNNGDADLVLGTVTIGGTEAADFTVTAAPTSPVTPGSTTTFDVTFDPSAYGLRSADVSFTTNQTDGAVRLQHPGNGPGSDLPGRIRRSLIGKSAERRSLQSASPFHP